MVSCAEVNTVSPTRARREGSGVGRCFLCNQNSSLLVLAVLLGTRKLVESTDSRCWLCLALAVVEDRCGATPAVAAYGRICNGAYSGASTLHDWSLKIPSAMAFCLFSAWTGNHGPPPMLMTLRWKISCDALFLYMTKRFLAIVYLSLTIIGSRLKHVRLGI